MCRSKRFELQGSSRGRKFPLLLAVITITTIIIGSPSILAAEEDRGCAPVLGKVVSLQGTVEAQRAGTRSWVRITRLDTPVCEGDRLRAGRASRAAVFVHPENLVRLDQNSELSFSHTPEETFIEFFQDPAALAADETAGCGAGYVITRFPKKFRIRTPHVNAVVEGTEFLVALRCETTELAVFEGKVRAQAISTVEEQVLGSGQVLAAGPVEPPAIRLLVRPVDAVQWALHYPPLTDAGVPVPSADECAQLPASAIRQVCFAQRAEQSLRAGRVEQAEGEIAQALAEEPASGDALAIRAIVSVVKGDKDGARSAAQKAVEASPNSSRAWLALSYAQQAHFRLEDALKSVQRAAEISASSSLVQARLAELFMSLGRTRDAEKAARRAVEANPNEERAYTVLGFVHLAQINVKAAQIDFQSALERDSSAPLPRLGLGLAIIRQGQLVPGREQLEIAVALDPTNSLLRSYVGKAYYEENTRDRDQLAATQFDLAKQLDPNDPTPWFYQAILRQTQNMPMQSIENLEASIKLNDNRAVFRSRLLLDQDYATRSTSLARVYQDLAFDPLALSEGYKSLSFDPSNYSAHRFLADAFLSRPRHEIARVSELLQAQLLQPISVTPVQPQLAAGSLGIMESAAPADASFGEYTTLFNQDRVSLLGSAIVGNHDTYGDDLVAFCTRGPLALSVGQFHYRTDGFRENNDQEHDLYGAFLQYSASPDTSLQLEFRKSRKEAGDTELKFDAINTEDPQNFSTDIRSNVNNQLTRVGGLHAFSPGSKVITSYSDQRFESVSTTDLMPGSVELQNNTDGYSLEVAHLLTARAASLATGVGRFRSAARQSTIIFDPSLPPFIPQPLIIESKPDVDHINVYTYANVHFGQRLDLTLGLSGDFFDQQGFRERNQVNPKLGVIWTPGSKTTVRAAAFRTLKRVLVANQTVEPTQVAGFNQFFDDLNGTDARRYGVGIDQRITRRVYAGGELSRRDLRIPGTVIDGLTGMTTEIVARWYERNAALYFLVAPTNWLTAGGQYRFERFERPEDFTAGGFTDLDTHEIPLSLSLFHPAGWSAQLRWTFVSQKGRFVDPGSFPTVLVPGEDKFSTADVVVKYQLPRRKGFVSIAAHNLLDQKFNYQDTDPVRPRFQAERTFFGRAVLLF